MLLETQTMKTWHRNAAYRYAYSLAADNRYQNKSWEEIEAEARTHWEKAYERLGAWEDFQATLKQAWHEFSMADDPYDVYLNTFKEHHQTYYLDDDDYNRRDMAYRYGYNLGTDDKHRGRSWDEVERDARLSWEADNQDHGLWDEVKEAVRYAWNSLTGQDDDYEDAREEFHKHYQTTYADRNRPYLDYDRAYRYGYGLLLDNRYPGRTWDDIEPETRQYWETEYRNTHAWDDYRDAVKHGYDVMQLRMGV